MEPVVCAKVREGDKRTVWVKEGNPSGCHVVIVYDLVQSGDTLIECQKVLAAHGATKVSAYVTHAVFPKKSWKKFVHKNGGKLLSLTLFVSFYFTLLMQCFRRTLGTFLVTRRICIFKGTRLSLNCVSTVSLIYVT
ncbi:putative ribose-phosphate diphosphokinase [Helianthus annuus]|nr:putative ribose-phosphate diphosphokinase [Helianthus annuus]